MGLADFKLEDKLHRKIKFEYTILCLFSIKYPVTFNLQNEQSVKWTFGSLHIIWMAKTKTFLLL